MNTCKLPILDSPTLGDVPETYIDKLFSYYLTTNRSQSNVYTGISSLAWSVSKCDVDPTKLKELITDDLMRLYGDYFDEVSPDVVVTTNKGSTLDVSISLLLRSTSGVYNLSKVISDVSGSSVKAFKVKNGDDDD